jgi:hypothetical protein
MAGTLSPSEHAQLLQTVEMFELITQNQPNDYQSLEILKEAYSKLGREADLLEATRRVARNYVQTGQLSSAIFEYESILQRHPSDPEAVQALAEIQSAANALEDAPNGNGESEAGAATDGKVRPRAIRPAGPTLDDGRQTMMKHFVESKVVLQADFDACWPTAVPETPDQAIPPFIQVLADRSTLPLDKSLKILVEKSHLAYMPMDKYDIDMDLARSFPPAICRRWCVLPFDRMGKTALVATANPFNQQASYDLGTASRSRLIFYVANPQDLMKAIKKAHR